MASVDNSSVSTVNETTFSEPVAKKALMDEPLVVRPPADRLQHKNAVGLTQPKSECEAKKPVVVDESSANVSPIIDESSNESQTPTDESVLDETAINNTIAAMGPAEIEAALTKAPIPIVDIDEDGSFKYILIHFPGAPSNIKGISGMYVVRGHQSADYHADLVDEVESYIKKNKIEYRFEVTGGGRISVNNDRKFIMIYGYSVGFGRANHSITCLLLKIRYPDYTVEWSNSGY